MLINQEIVNVISFLTFDVKVHTVEHCIAQRASRRMTAEEVIPNIVGEVASVGDGDKSVGGGATTDGDEDFDSGGLARTDFLSEICATVGERITVAGEVELWLLEVAK